MTHRPPNAIAFVRSYGFWYWRLANGRYQSCPDWREWLRVLGGECEFEPVVDLEREPDDREFVEMMGWI